MNRTSKALALGFSAVLCSYFTRAGAYADNIFVANGNNNTIVEFDSAGNETIFASNQASTALAFGPDGDLYVADAPDNRVFKFDASGNQTVFVRSGLFQPDALVFDSSNNLYLANAGENGFLGNVLEINSNGSVIAAVGLDKGIEGPTGIAIDRSNSVYVANFFVNTIDIFYNFNGSEVIVTNSLLNEPIGLAIDKGGNLYVANYGGNTIVKLATNGTGTVFASTDLDEPGGLAFDSSGNLFVSNFGDNTIEEFDTNGVGTLFASGLAGPEGIAIQVPEANTLVLTALAICAFLSKLRSRPRWNL